MPSQQALQLVYDAIDAVNPQLAPQRRLEKQPETIIVGASGSLDSLSLINLILALEERVGDVAGRHVQLLDDSALIAADGPFRTVGTLADHVDRCLGNGRS